MVFDTMLKNTEDETVFLIVEIEVADKEIEFLQKKWYDNKKD